MNALLEFQSSSVKLISSHPTAQFVIPCVPYARCNGITNMFRNKKASYGRQAGLPSSKVVERSSRENVIPSSSQKEELPLSLTVTAVNYSRRPKN